MTTLLHSMLFQAGASDQKTLAGVGLLVLSCSFFARFLPALAAVTLDPMDFLRTE